MKKILPFFSYLFHPIFIPLIGTVFYLLFAENYFTPAQNYLLLFQVIIITLFLPMSFFYLLRTFGKVDTIMLSDVQQRKMPLLLQMALTLILIKQTITIDRFPELFYFFLAGLLSTFIVFILIYVNIKASIHMIGLCALTFFVIGLSIHSATNILYTIAFLFVIIGLVASSRLQMKAHSIKELSIGIFIGIIPQVAFWYFWL